MLCQRCKKATATVHVTDLVGEPRELHLCEECAGQEGITVKSPVPINALLEDFIKHQVASQEMSDLACPQCGMSFLQFRQQGVLGCPQVPNKASSSQKKQHLVLKLRRQLEAAVEQEDYETAAKLRDQLKEFEQR